MFIELGETDPYTSTDYLIPQMNEWVTILDKQLAKEYNPFKFSEKYIKLFSKRVCTYDEFLTLFVDIPEEEYHRYRAYEFLQIENKLDKYVKLKAYNPDEESYGHFVKAKATADLDFFLRKLKAKVPYHFWDIHTHIMSKTRSGKSTLMLWLAHNAIRKKSPTESFVFIDPHGEFAQDLRRMKLLVGQLHNVVYLDFANYDHFVPNINILEQNSRNERTMDAARGYVIEAFQSMFEGQGMTDLMERALKHCIYALMYVEGSDIMTLKELLILIYKMKKKDYVMSPGQSRLIEQVKQCPNIVTATFFQEELDTVEARSLEGLISRVDRVVTETYVREFLTGKSKVRVKEFLDSGKIIIVNLAQAKLKLSSSLVGRIFLAAVYMSLQDRLDFPPEKRSKTRIGIDEIENFKGQDISALLSQLGKYGVGLMAAHQLPEQLDISTFRAFLSNTHTKFIGHNSDDVAHAMAGEMRVPAKTLSELEKYHWRLNIEGKDKGTFKTTSKILDPSLYISEEEAKEVVDKYMIERYYKDIRKTKQDDSPPDESNAMPLDENDLE